MMKHKGIRTVKIPRNPRKQRTVVLVIEAVLPPSVTKAEFRDYAKEAVACDAGALHPDDPLFDLARESVGCTLPHRDVATVLAKCENPVLRRQMIAALKDNSITNGWFE